MYKTCKKAQAKRRQKEILDIFISILKKRYLADLTVSELCNVAKIPRKVFYRYFDSQLDLIDLWCDTLFQELIENANINPYDRLTDVQFFKLFFSFWNKQKDIIKIIRKNQLSNQFFSRFTDQSIAYVSKHPFPSIPQKELLLRIHIILPGIISILYYWDNEDYKTSPNDLALMTHQIMTNPLIKK